MRYFMAHHRGDLVIVLHEVEDAGIEADLAAWQRKSVQLVGLKYLHLPLGGLAAGGPDHPRRDALHPAGVAGVRGNPLLLLDP